ncbi:ROK family transcriptional regulator [Herbiconiux ginsengi]|uniref:Sugar kinase of the NBD/HSP70 family, may contain an N-terminal HTH domain n=1 Tax=Herbiconiux ginsengi TaxID=381665 RepID=A0A1H3KZ69_9MICO|nr:ROK family transcriptional regulator [Herbiconiux ginsengi]SDY57279.1 Sugar kinase of the NBD/HSP70 family, may contain an N-terminal HTH domain [Herbiconiux ginsengi]
MKTFGDAAGDDTSSTRYRVLAAIRDEGSLSRAELARTTGLAASTITALIKSLTAEGLLLEADEATEAPGRTGPRSRELSINPGLGAVAGIDFGFRTVRVSICDLGAREIAFREGRLVEQYSSEEGLRIARGLFDDALAAAALSASDILAAGVALPGPIDSVRQRVIGSAVLPGWSEATAESMSTAFGVSSLIENDANLAALGEHAFGAGRGAKDSLTIKFHSGIGAGLIIENRLVVGSGSGEIGHFPVSEHGAVCRCGKRGCLDTFASIPALLEAAGPAGSIDLRTLLGLLADGDPRARRVVSDAAELVGDAASRACLLFAPERVIVVGAMSASEEAVIEPMTRALQRGLIPDTIAPPPVVRGSLAERSTVMGAIALALTASGWLSSSRR